MSALPAISYLEIGAVIVALIASVTDIRTGKIFNILTFPAALVGIIAQAVLYATSNPDAPVPSAIAGAITGIGGWLVAVLTMATIKFFLKDLGHGDTKLMGAIGAFVGVPMVVGTFIYFCLTYALFCCAWLATTLPWRQLTTAYMSGSIVGVDLAKYNDVKKRAIPIAPFIAAGLILMILLRKPTLGFLGFLH